MQLTLKIISLGLGLLLLESSFEHFYKTEWMTKHYAGVGFGFYGRFLVGFLQFIAGFGFIVATTRKITSLVFCIVMTIVIIKSLLEHSNEFPLVAVLLFIISFLLFILLKR
jgi:sugar phosphate permease